MSQRKPKSEQDGFTEQTRQGAQVIHGCDPPGDWNDDAEMIRTRFDIPAFDPEAFYPREGAALSGVYPDFLVHIESASDGPSTVSSPGASLTMVEAPKGSGKSTAADQFATYQMEHNDERIVRNGRQKSSDWRRMADWTTLWLPSGVDVDGRWMEAVDREDPDPEDLCRDVRYYSDVLELVERLQNHPKGTYNVVFPDPYFRKCEDALSTADATVEQPTFIPKNEPNPTPASHWWFGFLAARTFDGLRVDSNGERNWMTAHIDEFGMLAPESAPGGESGHWTHQCIQIMANIAKEMRSAGLSLVGYGHHEEDVHNHWLKEFDFWVELSNHDRGNRTTKTEAPKPFRDLEQDQDLLSKRPKGFGLCYTGSRFSEFQFSDLGYPHDTPEFQLRLGIPSSVDVSTSDDGGMVVEDLQVATDDEDQPTLLEEYRAAGGAVHELRVLAPGDGIIDISGDEPEVLEALSSPYADGTFPENPIKTTQNHYDIMFNPDSSTEIVAARIPRRTGPGATTEVVADD
ncbi:MULTISPECIES: hypothetical protein [unclassified Haloarcula]|uniref:hypothetical protein n=1 Tax=unclassified Haloarcula TaxID=2624677 RepID=UPI000EF238E5|nr:MULTISPECIES: hypothetical protein [unclassified Haloarcula]RLM32564.1 hypothetical protein DVK01_20870 [Haloarcula sp. Atlit-120R]RLM41235.1 hypothetical protein DVK00_20535 [Haloarcula sp. Atlit-47R]